MLKPIQAILLALAALAAASMACNYFRSQTPIPTQLPVIPTATEAIDELQQNLDSAARDLHQGKQVTLTITEAQLTSLVAKNIQTDDGPVLQNPQVYLQNGQVQLIGSVQQSGISLPLEILISMQVGSAGNLDYTIDSAKIGPLPLPEAQLNQLSSVMDQIIVAKLGQGEQRVVLDRITIADGTMVIIGHKP